MSSTTSRDPRAARPRGVSISDAMVLVAATAIGIALASLWHRALEDDPFLLYGFGGWGVPRRTRSAALALSVLIVATLATLALRARPPRPRAWLLARQPGTAACGSAALAVAAQLVALPLDIHTVGDASPFLVAAYYWPPSVAAAVLASWGLLVFGGRWRPAGDWVDRLGVLVGMGWVGLLPALLILDRF